MTLKTSLVIGGDAQDAIAALIGFEQRLAKAEAAARKLGTANEEMGQKATKASGLAQAGYINLGRQAQDVAVQLQGGANIGLIIGQQSSQIIDAFQMIAMAQDKGQGRFAKFASFLSGPWGIALTIATSLAVTFAGSLFDAADASDTAADASEDFAKGLLKIEQFADKTTGKLNVLTAATTRAAAGMQLLQIAKNSNRIIELRDEAFDVAKSTGKSTFVAERRPFEQTYSSGVAGALNKSGRSIVALERNINAAASAGDPAAKGIANKLSIMTAEAESLLKENKAAQANIDFLTGKRPVAPGFQPKATRTPRARNSSSGDNADKAQQQADSLAARIAGIKDEFSELPKTVEKANDATRDLDLILGKIEGKKGPQFGKMRADIGDAKKAIEDSLNRPFNEFLQKEREAAAIDDLLVQGKDDQAEAMKIVLGLEERMKPLTEAQLATVLATVEADRRRSAVLRDQRQIISAQVDAVEDMRGALENTVANALTGKFSLSSVVNSALNSYVNIASKKVVEAMFGDTLRKLEEEASGQSSLRKAADKMSTDLGTAGTAAKDLAKEFAEAMVTIREATSGPGAANPAMDAVSSNAVAAAIALGNAAQASSSDVTQGDEIVVTGRKPAKVDGQTGNLVVSMVDQLARVMGLKIPPVLVDGAKKLLGKLEGGLPNVLGTALVGSSIGQMAFGNNKGAGIGGAIGGVLGKEVGKMAGKAIGGALGKLGGPIGSILGSVLGAGLGKLVAGVKTGTATVGNSSGRGQVTGTGGNSASRTSAARGLASGALSALDQIVEQLGGQLGDFSGSIGIRNKKYVVDTTGAGRTKGGGVQKFATEAEAQQALLADMIADGAVKGVSAAVQRALSGSGDVEGRLKEALKVQELELAIGGIGAALEKEFRTFERQAAERVRIAREYGFDVVKVEQQNAKDRLKLTEKLLAEQVGSLQDLIKDMTSGSLFEGSSVDRRKALLDQIVGARAAVDAGTEGAADKLANLLDQLNSVSKEAFATTGTFAADRAAILDEARGAIAKANERITAAQAATDPALATTNAALSENNDQNAQMIAELQANTAMLSKLLGAVGSGGLGYLAALAQTSAR